MKDYILEILFETGDAALEEQVQSRLFLTASTGSTSDENGVYAYFDDAASRDAASESLRDLAVELRTTERERVDWLELYQQSLQPMEIGERFIVAPDPSLIPRDTERLTLVIPQEQAFGTGSHETTSMCLELLEMAGCEGKRGLDVGAGSGILSLAMLRLGAAKVIAFDNDVDTFAALRENRVRNGIKPEQMPLFIGGLDALVRGTFDVITMNILPDVILPLLPHIVWRMSPRARLILSGILITRATEVVASAERVSLDLAFEKEKGEWWSGVFQLPR
ncbi:MAG TPA: 50S ribosomal protein L11 methyltransferase [Thermoanaerobaculia bacterium]|nr:50S ribosomal protein L11 methyltransferase [Thermoanaerobaculia bacterium]